MLSLVLLLCQFFTFAHNIRYCYSTKQLLDCFLYLVFHINCSNSCSCVACNVASVSTFKSVFLCQFHVSFSSVIFYIYLTNCPYIVLFLHSFSHSFHSYSLCCYCIVSSAFKPSINGSTEFLP